MYLASSIHNDLEIFSYPVSRSGRLVGKEIWSDLQIGGMAGCSCGQSGQRHAVESAVRGVMVEAYLTHTFTHRNCWLQY